MKRRARFAARSSATIFVAKPDATSAAVPARARAAFAFGLTRCRRLRGQGTGGVDAGPPEDAARSPRSSSFRRRQSNQPGLNSGP